MKDCKGNHFTCMYPWADYQNGPLISIIEREETIIFTIRIGLIKPKGLSTRLMSKGERTGYSLKASNDCLCTNIKLNWSLNVVVSIEDGRK